MSSTIEELEEKTRLKELDFFEQGGLLEPSNNSYLKNIDSMISMGNHCPGDVNLHPFIQKPLVLLQEIPKMSASTINGLFTQINHFYTTNALIQNFILACTTRISSANKSREPIDLRYCTTNTIEDHTILFFIRFTRIITYNIFTRFFTEDTVEWTFEYLEVGKGAKDDVTIDELHLCAKNITLDFTSIETNIT